MAQGLTARENQLLIAVIKIATIDSKGVDWARVAEEAKFNTLKQARDRFAAVRNKLFAMSPVDNETCKGGIKRKGGTRGSEDATDGNDSGPELKKKKKKNKGNTTKGGGRPGRGKKAANMFPEPDDSDDDSGEGCKVAVKPEPTQDQSEGGGEQDGV